jgi:hypothetical protein
LPKIPLTAAGKKTGGIVLLKLRKVNWVKMNGTKEMRVSNPGFYALQIAV